MTLEKAYTPQEVEKKWYEHWLKTKAFEADPNSKKPAYSIVIPPPNVTGVLTMGHVLNNTLQDILVRRKRMQGFEVLWLPGTDHAGIATQTVVEKSLKKEKKIKHRQDLGREKFLEKIWEWKDKHGSIIIEQLKKLGCSCDWSRLVFTMDGLDNRHQNAHINYSQCVKEVFVKLYEKGLIYRGQRMVNWCPVSHTALSDEEVIMKEVDGHLWHIKYPLLDEKNNPIPDKFIIVATTRPETMLGDEAVAVHPHDNRYTNLIGCKVLLPLKNKPIPIIADEMVEFEFGSGAVKITPAHDPADYEMGLRHNLPFTVVIGEDGKMTELAGEPYEGLDRFECRKAVVADLEEWEMVQKVESYRHNVGFSERADVPIEPAISEQWFLKYPGQKQSLDAVLNGEIKFWPERWSKVYQHWMENLRDWCISRQLWWGHRIPVWYCTNDEQCPPIVSLDTPKKCPHCGNANLKQDDDVLDTWFSSWLWPFATMGWPKQTAELKKFYPTTDLVTGPDIIFFWVARMIMAGFEFMGAKPFSNVYYTGIIRDSLGRKMSKSLGNSPDPLDLIDKYGADGVRFGLMLIAPKGQDILFAEERLEVGRNFCNKLWNAARFVLMNLDCHREERKRRGDPMGTKGIASPPSVDRNDGELSPADKWILNRLEHAVRDVNQALDGYEFDNASRLLYQFVWRDFCDWYVELAKVHLYEEDEKSKQTALNTLVNVLTSILKLLHPYAPFITEEIWQQFHKSESIMYAAYPQPQKELPFEHEALQLETIKKVIEAIRNIRGEHNIKPSQEMDATLIIDEQTKNLIENNLLYLKKIANLKHVEIDIKTNEERKTKNDVATALIDNMEIQVPWKGLIDVEAEKARLTKEIAKADNDQSIVKNKLSKESFVTKAPADVVAKEREKLQIIEDKLAKFREALKKLDHLL
ncbi:MAG: valine--tRNA ligase [Pseudomonadota bacterium]